MQDGGLLKKHKELLICLFLIIAIFSVYWQVGKYGFTNYDDPSYVTENEHIITGINLNNIIWAFQWHTHMGNWHPLTWLSYMLDSQLFGIKAGKYHMENVLFHVLNTLFLFAVLKRTTKALWKSAFVAALFALHPLHVESVAWISERKDVLSTFFGLLAMWAYLSYAEYKEIKPYILALLLFILSLLAKPMLVTLPFVFLLMDYWPLGRIKPSKDLREMISLNGKLILEKIPLFMVSTVLSIITFIAQKQGGAVSSLNMIPLHVRIENALISYIAYLVKMIWPLHLAVLYPYPKVLHIWTVILSTLLLVCITLLSIRTISKYPYLTSGWLWYLVTLLPVIGIVQVGSQAMADRYTYIPLVGIFIMLSWGIPDIFSGWKYKKPTIIISCCTALTALSIITYIQIGYWKNSITLFEHTLEVTRNNAVALNNLGGALYKKGNTDEAIKYFLKAIKITPYNEKALNNLGATLCVENKPDVAIKYLNKALKVKPNYVEALNNLGTALLMQGKLDEGIKHFAKAIKINPHYVKAYLNLSDALMKRGNSDTAIKEIKKAIRLNPNSSILYTKLGNLYRMDDKLDEAIGQYNKALSIDPVSINLLNRLAVAYASQRKYDLAISSLKKIIGLKPDSANAYYNIACIYSRQNKKGKAVKWLRKAIAKGFHDWGLIRKDQDLENIRSTSYYMNLIKGH